MPGCCLAALLLFFGPRAVLAYAWLFLDWYRAFDSSVVALLGFLLAPWTSMAWMYIHFHHGGDMGGGYLVLLLLGIVLDVSALGGSHRARQRHYA